MCILTKQVNLASLLEGSGVMAELDTVTDETVVIVLSCVITIVLDGSTT